jgi:hypothetical protein
MLMGIDSAPYIAKPNVEQNPTGKLP